MSDNLNQSEFLTRRELMAMMATAGISVGVAAALSEVDGWCGAGENSHLGQQITGLDGSVLGQSSLVSKAV